MSELPPIDVFIKTISTKEWMNQDEGDAYVAGVLTAIKMVEVFVAHGIAFVDEYDWKVYSNNWDFFAEDAVNYVIKHRQGAAGWYTVKLFVQPELMKSPDAYYYRLGIASAAIDLFHAYRYLLQNFSQRKIGLVWHHYMEGLKARLLGK